MSQVSQEDGVLIFAEGEVASAFGRMLLGDQKTELLAEIVTKEEERVVAEVVKKIHIQICGITEIQKHRW